MKNSVGVPQSQASEAVVAPAVACQSQVGGWVKARNLTSGDHLQDIDGHGIVIRHVAVRKLDRPIRVFNITVSGTSTYYVGKHKILVHNKNV